MKSKSEIIEELWRSAFINDAIRTITSGSKLGDDLKSELFLILMEMPTIKIKRAWKENWLHYLVINILKKQFHSASSPFHKQFRNYSSDVQPVVPVDDEVEDVSDEMVARIEAIVETKLELVDRELFRMYFKIGRYDRWLGDLKDVTCEKPQSSYRKMQKKLQLSDNPKLTISRTTIALSIQRSVMIIKKELMRYDNDNN
jgi:hypothetical protein